jgi:hypothetical protein
MKNLVFVLLAIAALIGSIGAASAQYGPYYGPGYYGPRPSPYYRERYYDYDDGYYRGGRGYYPPGRYRTWNGCQRGWTVQDGVCKPYRGF